MSQTGLTIEELREQAYKDSLEWFPDCHVTNEYLLIHAALGLAGETGEAVDVIKKWHRHPGGISDLNRAALGAELADVFIYLLHICSATGIDLEAQYVLKTEFNRARFSKREPVEKYPDPKPALYHDESMPPGFPGVPQ